MSAENVAILVESQNFMAPPRKKKKTYGRETKTDEKREKFQRTEEMLEYLLGSLKRHNVMCHFSGKDFDADKTVQYSKLRKEMAKKYKRFVQLKPLLIQELIYRFRRGRNLRGK